MGKARRLRQQREQEQAPSPLASSLYPPNARSFELKMHRAHTHLQDLKAKRDTWLDAALKTVHEEPDPQRPNHYACYVTPPIPDHPGLSLLAGDCLQCLRSALDHLAFELAASFTVPMADEIEKTSEWPIFGDQDGRGKARFHERRSKGKLSGQPTPNSGLAKIRGIDPKAQTVIEGLQPYNRGNFEEDPLWLLNALNVIDKHRTIHVAGVAFQGAELPPGRFTNLNGIGLPGEDVGISVLAGIATEGRTKVAEWTARPVDPSKEVHVGFIPRLDIAFDPSAPIVADQSLYNTLGDLYNYLLSDVFPPLLPFLK